MLHVVKHFAPIENAICTAYLPALLGGTTLTTTPPDLCALLSLPIKSSGDSVLNPTDSDDDNHTTSSVCTAVLTDSCLNVTRLTITNHQKAMRDGRSATQASKRANTVVNLLSLTAPMTSFAAHQTTRNTETRCWISIQPTLVNGMSLSKNEWRDAMGQIYGLELLDLPKCWDGYSTKFTMEHTLSCKKGGLVVDRHKEVKARTGA